VLLRPLALTRKPVTALPAFGAEGGSIVSSGSPPRFGQMRAPTATRGHVGSMERARRCTLAACVGMETSDAASPTQDAVSGASEICPDVQDFEP